MPPESVSVDPGWDEDLAWLDRDPMTAAEFEASLDRLCERDEGPGEERHAAQLQVEPAGGRYRAHAQRPAAAPQR